MFGFLRNRDAQRQADIWRETNPAVACEMDKKRQDAYAAEVNMRQLEEATGRNRLDIAINGFPERTPLSRQG